MSRGRTSQDASAQDCTIRLRPVLMSCLLGIVLGLLGGVSPLADDLPSVDFVRDVGPVLVRRCLECHSGESPEGGLALTDEAALYRGGDSGAAIVPGDSQASLLWQRVEADEMPPKHPLTAAEKEVFADWIAAGGRWKGGAIDLFSLTTEARAGRDFWSLRPVRDMPPPGMVGGSHPDRWVRSPIDAFIRAGLTEAGLRPAAPADPRTLVRRVWFDLVGLPPSPEQIDAFLSDPSDYRY